MISIKKINLSDRGQREEFLKVQFNISKPYSNWIPGLRLIHRKLLDPGKNPYLKEVNSQFIIAKKKGNDVGRIAVFGPGHRKSNCKLATIGFVDCIEDENVFLQLLKTAEDVAKENGAIKISGPFNPNIHYDVGILTKGFEFSNAVLLGYNPPYYITAFENAGWEAVKIFQTWNLVKENFHSDERIKRVEKRAVVNSCLKLRKINIKKFDEELNIFYKLYCESFNNHWEFDAPGPEEFKFIAGDLKHLLKPEMGMVAELNGNPIGFVLGIPNIYRLLEKDRSGKLLPFNFFRLLIGMNQLKTMRVMIAGVLPEYQNRGIHFALFNTFTEKLFFEGGIESGEIGWVMKGNRSLEKTLSLMGAVPVKEYTVYEKKIQ